MSERGKPMGRPTKLNAELQGRIAQAVERGAPVETACAAEGIDPKTYYRWLQWGSEGKKPYQDFCQAITRARARAELNLLETATSGDEKGVSNGPARCAQWLLERTRGKRYAQRLNVKVEEELESLLDVVERVCSSKDCGCLEGILAALAARDSGEEAASDPGEPAPGLH